MIRMVLESSPSLYYIVGLCEDAEALASFQYDGATYYRSRSTPRWVLYKAAISGWGELKVLDPRQR